jgi:hypothetical protein
MPGAQSPPLSGAKLKTMRSENGATYRVETEPAHPVRASTIEQCNIAAMLSLFVAVLRISLPLLHPSPERHRVHAALSTETLFGGSYLARAATRKAQR